MKISTHSLHLIDDDPIETEQIVREYSPGTLVQIYDSSIMIVIASHVEWPAAACAEATQYAIVIMSLLTTEGIIDIAYSPQSVPHVFKKVA